MAEIGRPWANKVAVVTGGASGIGAATAAEFAARGANVAILDRAAPRTSVAKDCTYIQCDVTSASQIRTAAEQVSRQMGRVSFLVNSAGIQRYGTGTTTTEQTWDEVMAVNVKSMFL